MKSVAVYAVSLFTIIAILISGCFSDTDQLQIHHHQYRSQPPIVRLKSDDSNHAVTLLSFESYEEKTRTPSKTYSF